VKGDVFMFDMKQAINKVAKGENLTLEEAKDVMRQLLGGEATQAQIGSILTALRMKGETLDEIVGCATIMQEKAENLGVSADKYIDFVGTGGDGTNTFNISTTAVFVAAGAGVKIAKHGNRAISSKSGSVDVLESLGINVMLEAEQVKECFEKTGLGFMFAQIFHKSMKNVGQARREMGMRSIFNILGPLSNPSGAKYQLIGVFGRELTKTFAEAMNMMGVKRALVVHGEDGMDEITTTGKTYIAEIKDGEITEYTVTPEQFGIKRAVKEDIIGGDSEENAKTTLEILKGEEKGAKRDIVCLNAGAAIYIAGIAESIGEGIKLAEKSIDDGNAFSKLEEVVSVTKGL